MKLALVVASALMLSTFPATAHDWRSDAGATWLSSAPHVVPAAFGGSGNGNGNGNGNTGSGNGNGNGNGNAGSDNGNGNGNGNAGSDNGNGNGNGNAGSENGNRNGNNNAGSGFGNDLGNGQAGSGFGNDMENGAEPMIPGPGDPTEDYSRASSRGLPSTDDGANAPWEALWLELMGRTTRPPYVMTPREQPVESLY
jgi:hypothetical protein